MYPFLITPSLRLSHSVVLHSHFHTYIILKDYIGQSAKSVRREIRRRDLCGCFI